MHGIDKVKLDAVCLPNQKLTLPHDDVFVDDSLGYLTPIAEDSSLTADCELTHIIYISRQLLNALEIFSNRRVADVALEGAVEGWLEERV